MTDTWYCLYYKSNRQHLTNVLTTRDINIFAAGQLMLDSFSPSTPHITSEKTLNMACHHRLVKAFSTTIAANFQCRPTGH